MDVLKEEGGNSLLDTVHAIVIVVKDALVIIYLDLKTLTLGVAMELKTHPDQNEEVGDFKLITGL